jgi:hypothetical protein
VRRKRHNFLLSMACARRVVVQKKRFVRATVPAAVVAQALCVSRKNVRNVRSGRRHAKLAPSVARVFAQRVLVPRRERVVLHESNATTTKERCRITNVFYYLFTSYLVVFYRSRSVPEIFLGTDPKAPLHAGTFFGVSCLEKDHNEYGR